MKNVHHSHSWGFWKYSEDYNAPVRYCQDCGEGQSAFKWQGVRSVQKKAENLEIELLPGPDGPDPYFVNMLNEIKTFFEEKVRSGEVSAGRERFLRDTLNELEQIVNTRSGMDSAEAMTKIQELMARFAEAYASPSGVQSIENELSVRANRILSWVMQYKKYTLGEQSQSLLGEAEREVIINLTTRSAEAQNTIVGVKEDESILELEREAIRHLALDIKHYAVRNHFTIARPIWRVMPINKNPNAIFYSGGDAVKKSIETACSLLHLKLLDNSGHKNYSQERWEMLRNCHLAVFDFTSYVRDAAVNEAVLASSAAYELGIALALGTAVLIVAEDTQDLPFDIDVQSVRVQGDSRDVQLLSDAIENVLYGHQRGGSESSIASTYEFLQNELGDRNDRIAKEWMTDLDEFIADPIRFRRVFDAISSRVLPDQYLSFLPSWPGSYPVDPKQCFHITAYRDYTKLTGDVIRKVCKREDVGVEYIRGDEMTSSDIIRSIWDDISRSTFVVADLTSLNSNVLLELGIAHTLGRKAFLITQDDSPKFRPESIKKLRVVHYHLDDQTSMNQLESSLYKFFTSSVKK